MAEAFTVEFKNFIILNSGKKIFPEEIEAVYAKAAPVKEMCVFAVSGMQGVKK